MKRRRFLGVGGLAAIGSGHPALDAILSGSGWVGDRTTSGARSRQVDPRFDDISDLIEAKMAEFVKADQRFEEIEPNRVRRVRRNPRCDELVRLGQGVRSAVDPPVGPGVVAGQHAEVIGQHGGSPNVPSHNIAHGTDGQPQTNGRRTLRSAFQALGFPPGIRRRSRYPAGNGR